MRLNRLLKIYDVFLCGLLLFQLTGCATMASIVGSVAADEFIAFKIQVAQDIQNRVNAAENRSDTTSGIATAAALAGRYLLKATVEKKGKV